MSDALIKHIEQFVALKSRDREILNKALKPRPVKKKEYLFKEGEVCHSNYFVVKGCLRLFFINGKGTEQITQFAIENWWMSDYMSLDRQRPSTFYLQAVETSEIISCDTVQFEKLILEIPELERYFRIVQLKAYAAAQFRIRYLNELSKEKIYRHFVSLFPDFVQRVPQYMLASYLGFTPEYLSELRNKRNA